MVCPVRGQLSDRLAVAEANLENARRLSAKRCVQVELSVVPEGEPVARPQVTLCTLLCGSNLSLPLFVPSWLDGRIAVPTTAQRNVAASDALLDRIEAPGV